MIDKIDKYLNDGCGYGHKDKKKKKKKMTEGSVDDAIYIVDDIYKNFDDLKAIFGSKAGKINQAFKKFIVVVNKEVSKLR